MCMCDTNSRAWSRWIGGIGLLLGWLSVSSPVEAQATAHVSDETAGEARRRIQQMLHDELLARRKAWQELELGVHGTLPLRRTDPARPHVNFGHCDLEVVTTGGRGVRLAGLRTAIRSRQPKRDDIAFCPNWSASTAADDSSVVSHERNPPTPAQLRPFSTKLIAQLEDAVQRHPGNLWFRDQLIRVLVENGNSRDAQRAAACTERNGWCQLLSIYTAVARNRHAEADSLVEGVPISASTGSGMNWHTSDVLLDSADAAAYSKMPTEERTRLDSAFWWLATPFLGENGNARLTEHVVRLVRNRLNTGLPLEAQHDLRVDRGADALLTMRVRYGFPVHHVWIGRKEEQSHFEEYLKRRYDPPYSAMEYSRDNAAVAPTWAQVLDPLSLTDSSMALSAPRDATVDTWWPHEFFLHPRGRIVHLPASQRVWLRRDDHAVLVAATTVAGGELDALPRAPVRVVLAHSAGPAPARSPSPRCWMTRWPWIQTRRLPACWAAPPSIARRAWAWPGRATVLRPATR